jgi:hypothetical protein
MIWFLFLATIFVYGAVITKYFIHKVDIIFFLCTSFILGSYFVINLVYFLTAYLTKNLFISIVIYFFVTVLVFLKLKIILKLKRLIYQVKVIKKHELLLLIACLLFSSYIFSKTFSYDSSHGNILIASNVYADFGAHIPIIRSFSLGNNFPFEVPFFANKHILYHFMFDYYAGMIEYLGLRIDHALNLISTFAFTALLLFIYRFVFNMFKSKLVSLITLILFIFQSSLVFIPFVQELGLRPLTLLYSLWHNAQYFTKGPLGANTFSVYWSLDTFVNQRHTVFGFAFAFLIFYLIHFSRDTFRKYQAVALGVFIGLLPFWNSFVFTLILLFLIGYVYFYPQKRKIIICSLITAIIVAIPELLLIKANTISAVSFKPGFVIPDQLSPASFFIYWLWNLGFPLILGIIGFAIAKKEEKIIFLLFFPLFVISNLFQLSSDVGSSHKLMNIWIIILDIYAAFTLVMIYKRNSLLRFFTAILFPIVLLPGMINFFVIKNDVLTVIPDYPNNKLMDWAKNNIPPNKVILTNGEIYDPMSIIGKKIFLGWTYYIIAYGANPSERIEEQNKILTSKDPREISKLIHKSDISYLVFYKNNFAKNMKVVDVKKYKNILKVVYEDENAIIFTI